MAYEKNLKTNIPKYFLYLLTSRRNFWPILSIFFLTLPNTTAQQIGIWSAIGFLTSFIFEIPSGYFADEIGHKLTLVLSKIFLIVSMVAFIFATSLTYFIIGAIFLNLGISFYSGTGSAFMHNTLTEVNKGRSYTKIMSKIKANVSLISIILIIILPFLTKISILLPLQMTLGIDVFGLFIALSFYSPKTRVKAKKKGEKIIPKLLRSSLGTGFYPMILFLGILGGLIFAAGNYRYVYLEAMGLPIIFMGFVMGISRFFWFMSGHQAHKIEKKIDMKQLITIELFLFPLLYFLVALFSNPYIIGLIFALIMGYYWGRNEIITNYFLNNFVVDSNYKATMLSIKNQMSSVFQAIFVFLIGFFMVISYKTGYYILSIGSLTLLAIVYIRLRKYLK